MPECIAARLSSLFTPSCARGFATKDGCTGFVFEREQLAAALAKLRTLREDAPDSLPALANRAYDRNAARIDMYECPRLLAELLAKRLGQPIR